MVASGSLHDSVAHIGTDLRIVQYDIGEVGTLQGFSHSDDPSVVRPSTGVSVFALSADTRNPLFRPSDSLAQLVGVSSGIESGNGIAHSVVQAGFQHDLVPQTRCSPVVSCPILSVLDDAEAWFEEDEDF